MATQLASWVPGWPGSAPVGWPVTNRPRRVCARAHRPVGCRLGAAHAPTAVERGPVGPCVGV